MPLEKIEDKYIHAYLKFLKQGEAIANTAHNKYPGLPIFFENAFGLLLEIVEHLATSNTQKYPKHRLQSLLFFARALQTIFAAMDLAYKGYYAEAMALTRMVYETFTRVVFISVHPERSGEVFDFNTFKIRNMEQLLKYDLYEMYKMLSTFTHSHKVDVAKALYGVLKEDASISVLNTYDEESFTGVHNLVLFFLWAMLTIVLEVFPELKTDPEWAERYEGIEPEVGKYFRTHQNEHWRRAAQQVDLAKSTIRGSMPTPRPNEAAR